MPGFGLSGIIDGHPSIIAVASVKAVRDRYFQCNLDVEDKLRSGRIPCTFLATFDNDGFFNHVTWSLFHRAMDWWLAHISDIFGRKKMFHNIPLKIFKKN